VKIVQEDNQWALSRPRLQQLADAERDLVDRRLPVTEQGCDGGIVGKLRAKKLLDDLDSGPVGNAFSVRETTGADDGRVDPGEELLREARLADAGRPKDREQRARPFREHPRPGACQQLRLPIAADERCVESPDVRLLAGDRDEAVGRQRFGLSLRLEWRKQLDVDGVPHQPVGIRPQQHLADPGRLLQPGRDVDGVARDEGVATPRDDLARVEADPHVDLDRIAELEGCPDGAERIVLVHLRDAEHGHHRIADEFLDRRAARSPRAPSRSTAPSWRASLPGRAVRPGRSSRSHRKRAPSQSSAAHEAAPRRRGRPRRSRRSARPRGSRLRSSHKRPCRGD